MTRIQLIVGHVTRDSARIWLRGDVGEKSARLAYWPADDAPRRLEIAVTLATEPEKHQAGIGELTGLTPDTHYVLEAIFLSGDPHPGKFKTAPAAAQPFSFLLMSCNKNEHGTQKNYREIHAAFKDEDLGFMIHCGDQLYYDHEDDKYNEPSAELYARRYDETWGQDEYAREMLGCLPSYMMLDDHEVANDCNPPEMTDKEGKYTIAEYAEHGIPAYEAFQVSHGPDLHPGDMVEGALKKRYDYSFEHAGAKFFAVDVRLNRRPFRMDVHEHDMISLEQERALTDWLLANKDAMKFVITSLPFIGEVTFLGRWFGEKKWNSRGYNDQRKRILRFIARNGIQRLVFLCGDMHASYYANMQVTSPDGSTLELHELMSSPVYHTLTPTRIWRIGLRDRSHTFALGGGFKAKGKIKKIHPERSVTRIDVDPAQGKVTYAIYSLEKQYNLAREYIQL